MQFFVVFYNNTQLISLLQVNDNIARKGPDHEGISYRC